MKTPSADSTSGITTEQNSCMQTEFTSFVFSWAYGHRLVTNKAFSYILNEPGANCKEQYNILVNATDMDIQSSSFIREIGGQ